MNSRMRKTFVVERIPAITLHCKKDFSLFQNGAIGYYSSALRMNYSLAKQFKIQLSVNQQTKPVST